MLVLLFFSITIYAQNASLSFDPLTLLGLFLSSVDDDDDEEKSVDIRNLWLCAEANWETNNKKELGFGLFWRGDRFTFRTQWRNYFNHDRQSGFFAGLYGTAEYRKMFWTLNESNEVDIGWNYPFVSDTVYHSVGLSVGFDIGFRIRGKTVGLTPYIGLGFPLFYCFGDLPPDKYREDFDSKNLTLRSIDIGLRIDFFQRPAE
jgi:hypothetical protein